MIERSERVHLTNAQQRILDCGKKITAEFPEHGYAFSVGPGEEVFPSVMHVGRVPAAATADGVPRQVTFTQITMSKYSETAAYVTVMPEAANALPEVYQVEGGDLYYDATGKEVEPSAAQALVATLEVTDFSDPLPGQEMQRRMNAGNYDAGSWRSAHYDTTPFSLLATTEALNNG